MHLVSSSRVSKEVRSSAIFFSQMECSWPGALIQYSDLKGLKEYLVNICLPTQHDQTVPTQGKTVCKNCAYECTHDCRKSNLATSHNLATPRSDTNLSSQLHKCKHTNTHTQMHRQLLTNYTISLTRLAKKILQIKTSTIHCNEITYNKGFEAIDGHLNHWLSSRLRCWHHATKPATGTCGWHLPTDQVWSIHTVQLDMA